MTIDDFFTAYPDRASVLETIESQITTQLLTGRFRGPIKLIDSLIWLFSDDLNNTAQNVTTADHLFVLYSEAFKRIRSSFVLSIKGYFVDGSALLRSVYELNKAVNAIQHGILTTEYWLSEKRPPNFRTSPPKDQDKAINKHIEKVDNLVNNFDDRGVSPSLKDSLRIFKSNFHASVHKSLAGIALNLREFRSGLGGNLFKPFGNPDLFEISINNYSFLILMFLRNFLKSAFVNNTNRSKLQDMAQFIEKSYSTMTGYHKDILDYILSKY